VSENLLLAHSIQADAAPENLFLAHSVQADAAVTERLFVFLRAQARIGVGHTNGELRGALHDGLALFARHAVRDLSGECTVHHQQHLQLLDVVHEELLESVGADVLRVLVCPVANVGHFVLALVAPSHPVVDTLRLPPVWL